jgi:hypothetical protein
MIDKQLIELTTERARHNAPPPTAMTLPTGGYLITVPDVDIGPGWSQQSVLVLFVAPPGYPGAQPDCFWVEPTGLRLADGNTPQNTNDANQIPGDVLTGRQTTWFSWHLQSWNPNGDSLVTYFNVIMKRLKPAR